MPSITFKPSGRTIQVEPETLLLEAAKQCGIEVDAPCGGKGSCGNCALQVIEGRLQNEESGILTRRERDQGFVLACRARIADSDATVEVPEPAVSHGNPFNEDEGTDLTDPALRPPQEDSGPLTRKILISAPPAKGTGGQPDSDRLAACLLRAALASRPDTDHALKHKPDADAASTHFALPALRTLAEALRTAGGQVTVTTCVNDRHSATTISSAHEKSRQTMPVCSGIMDVTAVEAGDTTTKHFGVAIDVGTTTVALQLVDLHAMNIPARCSDYNSQLACGLDIISRIDYARRPERREELRRRILKTINNLIGRCASRCGIKTNQISCCFISGNTTMIHLLLGLDPEYIRLDPFTPTILSVPCLAAADIGIDIEHPAPVAISPAIGSYVGGDITAGVLYTGLSRDREEIGMLMDIGTNGEVVLGNGDFLLAAACSAGPAFEGGGIKCGMRAAAGAIEKVEVCGQSGLADCFAIGGIRPRGICGSGMISLLSGLLRTGWIDPAGKLNRSLPSEAIRIDGRRASYRLVAAADSATGCEITVDEQDIENIVRSKAAIYAACSLMLAQAGLTFFDVQRIYIAGSFGRSLDLDAAIGIGLLPNLPKDRFSFIGNASLKGATMALISHTHRERLHEIARRMTYLELATTPAYMDQYTAALFLPHTDPAGHHFVKPADRKDLKE
jgi:uncharacterized 2Fe-2S/4Fe-4S cluster protein (DUF4445 family)